MLDEVDVLPVIHACPLQMFVIDLKTEWVDEVQTRTDRQECSSGISCVVGNQRGAENHVQAFKRSSVQAAAHNGMLQWTVLVFHIRRKDVTSDDGIFIQFWSINQSLTAMFDDFKDSIVGKALRTYDDSKRSTTPLNFAPHWCLAFFMRSVAGMWYDAG